MAAVLQRVRISSMVNPVVGITERKFTAFGLPAAAKVLSPAGRTGAWRAVTCSTAWPRSGPCGSSVQFFGTPQGSPNIVGLSVRCMSSGVGRESKKGVEKLTDVEEAAEEEVEEVVDGMPRYPDWSAGGVLRGMDYLGTVVFAFSGSITAASSGMDMLGACVVGTITAVGGGTIRDAIIIHKRPFWSDGETEYIAISLTFAALAFLFWKYLEEAGMDEDGPTMLWGDALGVGAFAVVGAQNAIRAGMHPLIVVMCGTVTATFGGMTRDVLAGRPPRILNSHADIYASTAAGGATAYVLARSMGMPLGVKIAAGVSTAMIMRWMAWTYDLRLPIWTRGSVPAIPVKSKDQQCIEPQRS